MVGGRQVEPGAVRQQQVLLLQQVDDHLLVVDDLVHLGVEAGEQVQRAGRLVAVHAGDLGEQLPAAVPLVVQPAAGAQQPADIDAAVERSGDGVLRGDVRAEAHVGEEL